MNKHILFTLCLSACALSMNAQTDEPSASQQPPFGQFAPNDSLLPPPGGDFQPNDSLRRMGPPPGGRPGERGGQGMRPGGGPGGPGMGPGGMGGPGGRNISSESTLSERGIGLSTGEESVEGQTYTSTLTDENAVKVTGGTLTLTNCTINKPGADSNNEDGTSFYGTNSAVLSTAGTIQLNGGTITTHARGANAIVASGGTVVANDLTILCESNLSRGIHATNGGTITASNLTIRTKGNNSSVIATDRGGGTVTVNGGTYETSGGDCAVCYSTGDITVTGIHGLSEKGEIGVIEGDNEINYIDCTLESGDTRRGLMILQSGSGDAVGFNGRIHVSGGTLTLTSAEAPLIEITTRTQGTVTLKDVQLIVPSGVLMQVGYNSRWQTKNPVAFLHLLTDNAATYTGDIVVKDDGTSTVTVGEGVTWQGAYDTADIGLSTSVIVNGTWNLTADSYVDSVTLGESGKINNNGHKLVTKQ